MFIYFRSTAYNNHKFHIPVKHSIKALGNVLKSDLWFGSSEKEAAGTRPLTLYIVTCHKHGREGSQGPATPQQFLILCKVYHRTTVKVPGRVPITPQATGWIITIMTSGQLNAMMTTISPIPVCLK